MIEEQALSRVHRVGQKRNVTTIRYLMRDSFEEVCALLDLSYSFLGNLSNVPPRAVADQSATAS
jgi:hypothetical protein